jgi:hypothetical protein
MLTWCYKKTWRKEIHVSRLMSAWGRLHFCGVLNAHRDVDYYDIWESIWSQNVRRERNVGIIKVPKIYSPLREL